MRLGEVGKFIGGGTPLIKIKEYWGGNIPWAFINYYRKFR
ncbi:hypothetical protein [Bathymodiolus thermophilus thioautotrophic gill symbiont]